MTSNQSKPFHHSTMPPPGFSPARQFPLTDRLTQREPGAVKGTKKSTCGQQGRKQAKSKCEGTGFFVQEYLDVVVLLDNARITHTRPFILTKHFSGHQNYTILLYSTFNYPSTPSCLRMRLAKTRAPSGVRS